MVEGFAHADAVCVGAAELAGAAGGGAEEDGVAGTDVCAFLRGGVEMGDYGDFVWHWGGGFRNLYFLFGSRFGELGRLGREIGDGMGWGLWRRTCYSCAVEFGILREAEEFGDIKRIEGDLGPF